MVYNNLHILNCNSSSCSQINLPLVVKKERKKERNLEVEKNPTEGISGLKLMIKF